MTARTLSAAVVTFTFRDDGLCAVSCARSVAAHGLPHFVIEDAAAPLSREHRAAIAAAGASLFSTTHERRGNLNGAANLMAQLAAFVAAGQAAGAADWVIKLDSDTLLQRTDWLAELDPETTAAACFSQPKWWFQGPCYALSTPWLRRLQAALVAGAPFLEPLHPHYPEDVTTGWLATHVAGPAAVATLPGYPDGLGIAHWHYRDGPEAALCHPYAVLSFGNRSLLPSQMPPVMRRHFAGQSMAKYLANAPFSRL